MMGRYNSLFGIDMDVEGYKSFGGLYKKRRGQTGNRRAKMTNWIEIKDFNTPELGLYASLSEVQLLRYYEPKPGLFIAESPKVIQRAVNAGYEPISFLVEHKDLEGAAKEILAQFPETPVYTAEYDVLIKLTGFALTRGMLCAMKRRQLPVCRGNLSKPAE